MRSVSRILTIMYDRTIMIPFKLLLFFWGGFCWLSHVKCLLKQSKKCARFIMVGYLVRW